jgi:hypothetical protein
MILGNGDGAATEHAPTLDELFRRAGVRHPQAIALIDPPNRKSFTDGAPRTSTCAEADALISAFVAAIPDGIVGKRLASTGSNPQAIVSALLARWSQSTRCGRVSSARRGRCRSVAIRR